MIIEIGSPWVFNPGVVHGHGIRNIKRNLNKKGLRGSSNQRVNFLTDVYRDQEKLFLCGPRDMEAHLFRKHYLMVGIHTKNFLKYYEKECCQ